MLRRLHCFNPGHEMAVLHAKVNYTPSGTVKQMMNDLGFLPVWYSKPGDLVWMDHSIGEEFLANIPEVIRPEVKITNHVNLHKEVGLTDIIVTPWGISPSILHDFQRLDNKLIIPEWREEYFYLTSRKAGNKCYQIIHDILSDEILPSLPVFCSKLEEVDQTLERFGGNVVIKTPYSSSGRGLLWVEGELTNKDKEWLKGALKRQEVVSIEPTLRNVMDFAMEFYSDGAGHINYEGLSVFNTDRKGAYSSNKLATEKELIAEIEAKVGEGRYNIIKNAVIKALEKVYADIYTGFLGVDMMVYEKENHSLHIYPCIEVNMRYTMGLMAHTFYKNFVFPDSTGNFYITYEGKAGEALNSHLLNQEKYPLVLKEGKLEKGYFSLCPVNNKTHYRAFLILD